ncbi:MAG: PA0069 family radical SAM protein [Cyclobacteriaceae bacterium]
MDYLKGKGAQINVPNRFLEHQITLEHVEGIDEELLLERPGTEIFYESPKKIISYNNSPDIGMSASINPYQGCEHGCVYCYARNSHEYWGFSAGLDFETKIIVKPDAPALLERTFLQKNYKPKIIMLSGNTDCYQPLERKFKITREILDVCLKYKHPIGIITKNTLVTRDIDILSGLAKSNLVQVIFSITSEDEKLRRLMEPRTASAKKKFKAISTLSQKGIPVGIMNAPIIPSLNHHEIPSIIKRSAEAGAAFAGYTVVRLNGQVEKVFHDWLLKNFPGRAEKVWKQIGELHGGSVGDAQFGRRISGGGKTTAMIKQLFETSKRKYMKQSKPDPPDLTKFRKGGNYSLF